MKCKGMKVVRKIFIDFEFIRMEFLVEVKIVNDYDIFFELIINFD